MKNVYKNIKRKTLTVAADLLPSKLKDLCDNNIKVFGYGVNHKGEGQIIIATKKHG